MAVSSLPLGGDIAVSIRVTEPSFSWASRHYHTLANRWFRRRKVLRALASSGTGVKGFHMGVLEDGYFEGQWEPSFVLSFGAVTSEDLDAVARALAREFHQICVRVADHNRNTTVFIPES